VLTTDLDDWETGRQAVSLMTLHAAKGLEFPAVFVVAVEQGILPHQRAKKDDNDFEEERRLLFVGMTRAKEELYLSHVTSREFRGRTERAIPSPFLLELPARPIAAAPDRRTLSSRGLILTAAEFAGESNVQATGPGDFQQGMLVRHPEFGLGRIAELSGYGEKRKAIIKFTAGATRTFMLSQAKLHPVKAK
jgi:DNA helicase-2/ATP-dependent DNA helicase PcrA